ncbi:hypothetical protein AA0481_0630 [Acetobacter orientalis NRIC 0481]|uniref:Uncharacterized protein n=1 Tax=Acetobacter orientalis TaxID=146474 RepID=A0A0D6NL82_9PROT|nr:hypothetical protein Abor_031_008 [Acetobacter orientalis]GBR14501.1 hypothetical protein AA0481_0630 [Acetobacter orientalis NRIC 0481]GEL60913.1 hypothetical protein AOR02nite_07550 [Acetobacter orientalis]
MVNRASKAGYPAFCYKVGQCVGADGVLGMQYIEMLPPYCIPDLANAAFHQCGQIRLRHGGDTTGGAAGCAEKSVARYIWCNQGGVMPSLA